MNPTKPERNDPHALVDLLDVLLRDGVILQADVVITVADVPLVGVNLRAAIAGMTTMTEYGFFEDWDAVHRDRATGSVAYTPYDSAEISTEFTDSAPNVGVAKTPTEPWSTRDRSSSE